MTVPDQLIRHLAAVMFTDMAGYTALMQRDEAAALLNRARHREALEQNVPTRAGDLLQYFGDGSLCIFRSSLQAVEAAIEIQRHLEGHPALRIGVHIGDIAYDAQGAYGDAINIAARLESLCVPGGVTISNKVYDDIRRHPQLTVVHCGDFHLKNVEGAVPTYALSVDGVVVPPPAPDPEMEVQPTSPDYEGEALPPVVIERLRSVARHAPYRVHSAGLLPGRIPFVGREQEIGRLRGLVEAVESGNACTAFFRGPWGVGKTRLSREVAEYAADRGWIVLTGRSHPSERLVPYAPFSDALMPVLGGLSQSTLARLTPGSDAALCALFPALGAGTSVLDEGRGLPGEARTKLYWQFSMMLSRFASEKPLLFVLEDFDFADRASVDLLEFVARHTRDQRVLFLVEYAGSEPERRRSLLHIEQSLSSSGAGVVFELAPLNEEHSVAFVHRALDLGEGQGAEVSAIVHRWSRGNPLLMIGTLQGLIEGGAIRPVDGRWQVANLESITPPPSFRDAVRVWMSQLSEPAQELARYLAILERRVSYEVVRHVYGKDETEVARTLDELVRHQILIESEVQWSLSYSFRHPMIRETLATDLSLAERREHHTKIAAALEAFYADTADEHAGELAYHFGRAHPSASRAKAIQYLIVAGTTALERHANREAVAYLQEALHRIEAAPPREIIRAGEVSASEDHVIAGLARARRRIGDSRESVALWRRLLARAETSEDLSISARVQREIGLTQMAGGALEEAIESLAEAGKLAHQAKDASLAIRSRLALGFCYQAIGDAIGAGEAIESSLVSAQALGRPDLLGRVHSALLRLNIWSGQVEQVRFHAKQALTLSGESGDRGVEFWSQWAMGAMEGLIGHHDEMARRISEARRLSEEIGSPFLQLETSELAVELAYARGEWEEGIEMGTRAIELGRSGDQRMVLPRLLVWVSLIHLGRGEIDIADRLISEAWEISRADEADRPSGFLDVHSVVPAHIGRAAFHLACGEWSEAIRVAEDGLAIADRSGYIVWAIHRLLPIVAEACIYERDLERAKEVGKRMRREAEAMGHPLGLAWADACDALVTWLAGDAETGVVSLLKGAEALETIPLTYEAARLRRQLAGRLAELGDQEAAERELGRAYAVFESLGAKSEIEKSEEQFRQIGVDPPVRDSQDIGR